MKTGLAISLCDASERGYIDDIHKLIDRKIPLIDGHPFPAQVKRAPPPTQGGRGGRRPGRRGRR